MTEENADAMGVPPVLAEYFKNTVIAAGPAASGYDYEE